MTPPDDITYTYPLVVIIRDDYDPESAVHLLRGLAHFDDESAVVSVRLHAMDAERWLKEQVN